MPGIFRYLGERRRVIFRLLKHHALWFFAEAFGNRARADLPTVIFVRRSARSRIYNHAASLATCGFQSLLVAQAFDYPYHREMFPGIYPWYKASSIPAILRKLIAKHKVIAIVSSLQPSAQTLEILKEKWPAPVFIDHHDSAWSQVYFQPDGTQNHGGDSDPWLSAEEVEKEKYCFTHVDGVIARSNELVELFQANSVTTPTEVFEDCCAAEYFEPIASGSGPRREEWAIAYAGMVFPMDHDPRFAFPQFVNLASIFARERIHFHIYPGQHHEYLYPEYDAEAGVNPYFHMHRSVDFGAIRKELARYDFGLVGFNPPSDYRLFSPVHFRHILHAKFHTYLEAGLPIIVSRIFAHEADIIRKYQAGFVVDQSDPAGLRKLIESADIAVLRRNVAVLRNDFLAERQGARLRDFLAGPISRP
ncbi:MAG: hypothetical protein EPO31_12500 [Gammaproteobacteria bacterium]|jgi:hypothetical protein|nr:MAG: hypothetical protein EPO31_12500 [Gammaproteobacteria bacterium]